MIVSFRKCIEENKYNWQPFLKIDKKCSCICCCFKRPAIEIAQIDTNDKLGHVINDWDCCNYTYSIYETGNTSSIYSIKAGCCQCGFICNYPAGYCEEVNLDILDNKGTKIGSIRKIWGGCDKPGYSDPDYYEVRFPKELLVKHKALIMGSVLYIDYRYFEEKIPDTRKNN